ncbi:MAG: hypothetical protein ACXVIY_02085 [Mucilaginibacter sp.]
MYLIHSALRDPDNDTATARQPNENSEIQLRYRAYTEVCQKHWQYIADIRKHFPNWIPTPPTP